MILIDYAGFNLKIAAFAKKHNIKVFYYIPPKLWAWNSSRVKKIKEFVDHLLVIFPFEVDFYKKYNINATYVGNPSFDEIRNTSQKDDFKINQQYIALVPGSRKQEIDSILPEMLKIVDHYKSYNFIITATNQFTESYYKSFVKNKNVEIVFNKTYSIISNAKAALVTSGTASLETALLNIPQVVCYKTNYITYIIARYVIKIPFLSLVNILMNKNVVKELIQNDLNKYNLIISLDNALERKELIINEYNKLKNLLGNQSAAKKASNYIISNI